MRVAGPGRGLAVAFAIAACDGSSSRPPAYSRPGPRDALLVVVERDRNQLQPDDVGPWRCILRIDGAANGSSLGLAACAVADQDGDGIGDFALGGFDFMSSNPWLQMAQKRPTSVHGFVVVLSYAGGELGRIVAEEAHVGIGSSLEDLGDVDGDGTSDWAFGAPSMSLVGIIAPWFYDSDVRVVSGADGTERCRVHGAPGSIAFGAVPDVDRDEVREVCVAFWKDKASAAECTVRSGSSGSELVTLDVSEGTVDAICAVGDIDGDGTDDIALGVGNSTLGIGRVGAVLFHSGRTGARLGHVTVTEKYDQFGEKLCGLGDLDGDGIGELLVATPNFSRNEDFRGKLSCLSPGSREILFELEGQPDGTGFGTSLVSIDDVDGDGLDDVAASTWSLPSASDKSGRVSVFALRANGLRELTRLPGSLVHTIGDLDGDGRDELATANPNWPDMDDRRGRVWVFARREP